MNKIHEFAAWNRRLEEQMDEYQERESMSEPSRDKTFTIPDALLKRSNSMSTRAVTYGVCVVGH